MAAALLLARSLSAEPPPFVAPAPEDLVIYHLLVDRFDNGDPANDRANRRAAFDPSAPTAFHGGDFAGIARRLDYIAGLGVNAIWLSPVLENVDAYHGYHTYDWFAIEPNFGTRAELVALVEAANAHGLAVYLDMVAGHAADLLRSTDPGYPRFLPPPGSYRLSYRGALRYPPPFDDPIHYNAHGHISRFEGVEQELGELLGLDDLRTTSPYVREHMTAIWLHWLEQLPISGFRVDTVKHVEREFWEHLLPAVARRADELGRTNYFAFGEVHGGDDALMRPYVGSLDGGPHKLDGALDFPFHHAATDVFARQLHPPSHLLERLAARADAMGSHHLRMVNFLDSHDVRRFLGAAQERPGAGLAERQRRLDLALIFLMTAPGIPVIYYGTEQGFDGGIDPYNREDMFAGAFGFGPSAGDSFDDGSRWYRLLRRLTRLRSSLPALRHGELIPIAAATDGPGLLAYGRDGTNGDAQVIVLLNTATTPVRVEPFATPWPEGRVVVNGLDPARRRTIGPDGLFPPSTLGPQAAEVWLARDDLPPVLPDVIASSPADGEIGVPTTTDGISLSFSTTMDRAATEQAIRIEPPLDGAFAWSDDATRLTFSPTSPLVPRTTYRVDLATDARGEDGRAIDRRFVATWRTGREARRLPPPPPLLGELPPTARPISVDARGGEWRDPLLPDAPPPPPDTAEVTPDHILVWHDAVGDDVGHGSYVYPTSPAFAGGDADLVEFRFAFTPTHVFLYARLAAILPDAEFFTPYLGFAIDSQPGGRPTALGFDQRDRTSGDTQLVVRPDIAPDFEVIYTGPRGALLVGPDGEVPDGAIGAHTQETGEVEIAVSRAALGLGDLGEGRDIALVVYVGLETFGTLREVSPVAEAWMPGGGREDRADPDVFDLAGAPADVQRAELADFDRDAPAMVTRSLLRIRLVEER